MRNIALTIFLLITLIAFAPRAYADTTTTTTTTTTSTATSSTTTAATTTTTTPHTTTTTTSLATSTTSVSTTQTSTRTTTYFTTTTVTITKTPVITGPFTWYDDNQFLVQLLAYNPPTYINVAQNSTIYGNDGTFVSTSEWWLQGVSFSHTMIPSHSFGLSVKGGNMTLSQINPFNVVLNDTAQVATQVNSTFYYVSTPSEVDIFSTIILQPAFYTNYANFSAYVGNAVYDNTTGHFLIIKTTSSAPTLMIWFGLANVAITLVHANAGNPLALPDYMTVNYIKGGTPQVLDAVDGTNVLYVDPASLITINGISGNPTASQRFCLAGCSTPTVTEQPLLNFSYWTQNFVPVSYSVAAGTPISTEAPYFDHLFGGDSLRNSLSTNSTSYWIDDGLSATPQNPWFSNLQIFKPYPTSAMILNANPVNFAYSINGAATGGKGSAPACINLGTNTTALFQAGCYAPAIFYTFANVLSPPVTWALLLAAIAIPTQLVGKNILLTFTVSSFIIGFIIYATSTFPPIVADIMLLAGAGAAVATLVRLARRGNE